MRGPIPFFTLCLTVRARASETRSFKFLLAVILWLALPVIGHASTINRTSQQIPNDAQGAFMAAGGFQTVCNDLVLTLGIAPVYPLASKWWFRMPLEVAEAYGFWYVVQAQTGAIETKENDANRATCAAWGALGTSGALCVESWNFGLGGCRGTESADYKDGYEGESAWATAYPMPKLDDYQRGFRDGELNLLEAK